ncbi:hypothetical protein E4O86_22725 [Rhizobiales bacterium L72]|uniref:Uncharacterized protein n=1 Tax=Propylenella binzhouense TaxID=2555902 RepID=A0A964TAZ5_9HYPH|nr:hypothetical protein [Propylenella binzhouense]
MPAQPRQAGGSAQQIAGQSGVAVEAPKPNTQTASPGSGQNAPQTSGISAPVPAAAPKAPPKESVVSVADAEALANAGDQLACRAAARKMRLAGVAMPAPLLALAALDPKFYNAQPGR